MIRYQKTLFIIFWMFITVNTAWSQKPVVVAQGKFYLHSFGATAGKVALDKSKYDNLPKINLGLPFQVNLETSPDNQSLYLFSVKSLTRLVKKYNYYQKDAVRFRMIPPKISLTVAYK